MGKCSGFKQNSQFLVTLVIFLSLGLISFSGMPLMYRTEAVVPFTSQAEMDGALAVFPLKVETIEPRFDAAVSAINSEEEIAWCKQILANVNHTLSKPTYWASQFNQDWFLYSSMFRHMEQRGVFLDIATNYYRVNSNTFFFEKCLKWNGICVEPEPILVKDIRHYRSCDVVDTCIWNETNKTFNFISRNGTTGMMGLEGYNKIGNRGVKIPMKCKTAEEVLSQRNVRHVDYMSLDIEGAELFALQGIDWDNTQIDTISVETNNKDIIMEYLISKGYEAVFRSGGDLMYIHHNATQKRQWFDEWVELLPNGGHRLDGRSGTLPF